MKKTFLGLALATAAFVGHANAAQVYPVTVISADQNGTAVAADRSDVNAVKGAADGIFYSLGLGGNMILDFGTTVTSPGAVTEVTYKLAHYVEILKVLTSKDGATWTEVASVVNGDAQTSDVFSFVSTGFRYVKLLDASPVVAGRDGFDVDSISFSAVPVPAAGLLLAGGLAGLGALRRRAKKA